jgi:acyl-CoA-binding protein
MKGWKPRNPPSNRDRLELYALHKQVASGDAPTESIATSSDAEMAKYNAWKSKRGLLQEEAMRNYVSECDRQMRVYGTAVISATQTPTTTPSAEQTTEQQQQHDAMAISRGLAAIPLLCAAASETRPAYLSRLRATPHTDGWWSKQEPLCAEPYSLWATPETVVLYLSSLTERLSLFVGGTDFQSYSLPLKPSALQAFLWPFHNTLLALWVAVIITCTTVGSIVILSRTLLYGSNTTNVPLESTLEGEVIPSGKISRELCFPHQALSVRLVGLSLWPLVLICDVTETVLRSAGTVAAGMVYIAIIALSWWYWLAVLPWLAFMGVILSISLGFGFFLIELAGMQNI